MMRGPFDATGRRNSTGDDCPRKTARELALLLGAERRVLDNLDPMSRSV